MRCIPHTPIPATSLRSTHRAGECKRNVLFMSRECTASCGLCAVYAQHPDAPTDAAPTMPFAPEQPLVLRQSCKAWAEAGECGRNPKYMQLRCRDECSTALSAARRVEQVSGVAEIP